jgi:hypothetical protein
MAAPARADEIATTAVAPVAEALPKLDSALDQFWSFHPGWDPVTGKIDPSPDVDVKFPYLGLEALAGCRRFNVDYDCTAEEYETALRESEGFRLLEERGAGDVCERLIRLGRHEDLRSLVLQGLDFDELVLHPEVGVRWLQRASEYAEYLDRKDVFRFARGAEPLRKDPVFGPVLNELSTTESGRQWIDAMHVVFFWDGVAENLLKGLIDVRSGDLPPERLQKLFDKLVREHRVFSDETYKTCERMLTEWVGGTSEWK